MDDKNSVGKNGWIAIGILILVIAIYGYIAEGRIAQAKIDGSFYERESQRLKVDVDSLESRLERISKSRSKAKEEHSKIKTDEEILENPFYTILDSSDSFYQIRSAINGQVRSD